MNTNTINFNEYKQKISPEVVYVNDIVEWQDYNGDLLEAKVLGIQHKPLDGFDFAEKVKCMPMWEKNEYFLTLEDGLTVIGDCVVRKIVKKRKSTLPKLEKVNYV